MSDRRPRALVGVVVAGGLLAALTFVAYRQLRGGAGGGSTAHSPASSAKHGARPGAPQSPLATEAASEPPLPLPVESPYSPADRAKALELLNALKQNANVAFQEGRFEDALKGYQDCIEVTSVLGAGEAEAVKTEQIVRANVAMVCIRMHEYDAARAVATMLLQDAAIALPEDLKVKVLYRRGLASKALNDRESAMADFNAALHFSKDHKNPAVEKEIALLQRGA